MPAWGGAGLGGGSEAPGRCLLGLCWWTCEVWPILGSGHSLHRPNTQGALCPPSEERLVGSGHCYRSEALQERPLFLAGVRWTPTSSSPGGQSREQGLVGAGPGPRAEFQPHVPTRVPAASLPRVQSGSGARIRASCSRPPGLPAASPVPGPREWLCLATALPAESPKKPGPKERGGDPTAVPWTAGPLTSMGQPVGLWPWPHRARPQLSWTQPAGPPSSDPRPKSSRSCAVWDL